MRKIKYAIGPAYTSQATSASHPVSTPVNCRMMATMLSNTATVSTGGAKKRHGLRAA